MNDPGSMKSPSAFSANSGSGFRRQFGRRTERSGPDEGSSGVVSGNGTALVAANAARIASPGANRVGGLPPEGSRTGARRQRRSAITGGFFTRKSDRDHREKHRAGESRALLRLGMPPRPLGGIVLGAAAVLIVSLAVPMAFTRLATGGIDAVVTGSIRQVPVEFSRQERGGQGVVTVSGRVYNGSGRAVGFPALTVRLLDRNGRTVQSWRHNGGDGLTVEPGESVAFTTSAIDITGLAYSAEADAGPGSSHDLREPGN